jgi:hypothetical protein
MNMEHLLWKDIILLKLLRTDVVRDTARRTFH